MPLSRKQQILFKRETSEAVNAVPLAADAVLVFEPSISDSVETTDRVPAGSSLSREVVPTGRRTRTIGFQSDLRGSGDTSGSPVDAPDWGPMIECSAYETATLRTVPVSPTSGDGYHLGEIVQQSSSVRAIVCGMFDGAGAFTHRLGDTGSLVVIELTGTLANTVALTGESSGTVADGGTVADYAGRGYKPTSEKVITLTASGGFTGGGADPVASDVVTIERSSVQVGLAQVTTINAGGTSIEVTILDGEVASGDAVIASATASATLTSPPVMTKTPSATIRHNLDGRARDLIGARGDFEITADAGSPLSISWTWSGDPATAVDALPVATAGLGSIRAPRLFAADGAVCTYARTVNVPDDSDTAQPVLRLATKSVSYSSGNSVAPDLDANSAGGARGANVTDRDPTFSATVNQAHSGFDWEDFRDNSRTVHAGVVVGNTPGNIVGFVIPNGQVLEANIGDSDGVATHEVQIKPRRVLEQGDDEIVFFQL